MYIDEANKYNRPLWRLAYDFKHLFGIQTLDYNEIAKAFQSLLADDESVVNLISILH